MPLNALLCHSSVFRYTALQNSSEVHCSAIGNSIRKLTFYFQGEVLSHRANLLFNFACKADHGVKLAALPHDTKYFMLTEQWGVKFKSY